MKLNNRNLNPHHHARCPSGAPETPETDNARAASVAAGAAHSCEPSASRSRPNAGDRERHHGGER